MCVRACMIYVRACLHNQSMAMTSLVSAMTSSLLSKKRHETTLIASENNDTKEIQRLDEEILPEDE